MNAALLQQFVAEIGELFAEFGQDARRAVQQDDPEIAGLDVAVASACHAEKFVDFGCNLDAGVAATGDYECERLALVKRILFHIGGFQHADKVVAQAKCVAERLECEGVFGNAGEAG